MLEPFLLSLRLIRSFAARRGNMYGITCLGFGKRKRHRESGAFDEMSIDAPVNLAVKRWFTHLLVNGIGSLWVNSQLLAKRMQVFRFGLTVEVKTD